MNINNINPLEKEKPSKVKKSKLTEAERSALPQDVKQITSKSMYLLRKFFGYTKNQQTWCDILGEITIAELAKYENGQLLVPLHLILFFQKNGIDLNWFFSEQGDMFIQDAYPSGILEDDALDNFTCTRQMNVAYLMNVETDKPHGCIELKINGKSVKFENLSNADQIEINCKNIQVNNL